MKTIGIIRNLDMLGRIVEKDGLEIFVDKECIVLRKYKPTCIFCNSVSDVTEYKGKKICASCFDDMSPR